MGMTSFQMCVGILVSHYDSLHLQGSHSISIDCKARQNEPPFEQLYYGKVTYCSYF